MYLKELENLLEKVFTESGFDIKPRIIVSNRPDLCDYQCDDIFRVAKEYHKNPIEIGEVLVNKLKETEDIDKYFSDIEFVKPGFINFKLSGSFLASHIFSMYKDEKFGVSEIENKTKIIVDYGGPNIAKPLHVGHMRSAIIGEAIKRILRFKGYDVIGDVHLGDAGLQMGQVIYGIMLEHQNTPLEDVEITIDYLNDLYPRMSILSKEDENVLKECQKITRELQEPNNRFLPVWEKINDTSLKDIKRLYKYLNVDFDLWNGEIITYPIIPEMVKYLEDKNVVEESEGLKVINVKEESDTKEFPPLLLLRSDGGYIYPTTDLATIYMREKEYNPDYMLYITDNRQSFHFEQVFRATKKSQMSDALFEHLPFGTINGPDNKPYKTRSGGTVKLEDFIIDTKNTFLSLREENKNMKEEDIDIIVNAILKFADLQNNRERNYIFDLEKFSNVVGKTGPYILYTYLRINKIIKDFNINSNLSDTIYNESDKNLKLKLLEVGSVIDNATNERMPNYIADYLYDLCVIANNFYQNNYLNNLEDEKTKNDWIILLTLTNKVIKELLNLLAIDIPSEM